MVQVDFGSVRERDLAIDLEKGVNALVDEEGSGDDNATNLLNRGWNGIASSNRSTKREENTSYWNHHLNSVEEPLENGEVLVDNRLGGGEEVSRLVNKAAGGRQKKKGSKKPPKPPRPPRAPSMDAADQKLIRELSEAAMLKRARMERMKALKRMKNAKSASSGSNLSALIITLIFCFVIIWQGLLPKSGSNVSFQGSPESSMGARGGFISVQLYKNVSTPADSSSASPNNVDMMSGLDDHRQASRGAGYAARRMYR